MLTNTGKIIQQLVVMVEQHYKYNKCHAIVHLKWLNGKFYAIYIFNHQKKQPKNLKKRVFQKEGMVKCCLLLKVLVRQGGASLTQLVEHVNLISGVWA